MRLPPEGPQPDKLYVATGGTGVPMVAAGTEARAWKGEDGKARTREVKMACAFTQATVDDDGYPVRDPASSSCLATFAPAPDFGVLMAAEARRRGAGHIRQLTILGDGAVWIWNLAARHFPSHADQRLFHAREHVHELANLAARLLAGHRDDWLAERLAELDAGDTGALLAAGRSLKFTGSLVGERDKALHYFQANATRMHYAWYRAWACSPATASSRPAANPSRPAAQAIGHEMDRTRSHRHPHPPMPGSQQPLGRKLAARNQASAA